MICSDFCFRRKCLAAGEFSRESREKQGNWEEAAVLAQGAGSTRAPRAGRGATGWYETAGFRLCFED